ncbi:MAG: YSC84-related protein [Pseudomonadota bacterium]
MQRRDFMLTTAASLAVAGVSLGACSSTASLTTTPGTHESKAGRRAQIDAGVNATLTRLENTVGGARELVSKASGILIFPSVIAAGLAVGGEYGEGVLRVKNATTGYYSLASLSFGLQIGAQSKAIVILLMTQDALTKFRNSQGWAVGADASVAVLKVGANGMLEVTPEMGPIVAFVMTNAGLMANLTLEGTKITQLKD